MKWDEKSSDEMSWNEVQVWSVECGVWRTQCEVWGKCLLDVALRRGRAQVMFLDTCNKARTHGPGWRTAHASSLVVVLGSDSWKLRWQYEKRWHEKIWAGIRWEGLRWDEVWSVKSAVWSVGREECNVKCGVWSVKCGVRRKPWEVWSAKWSFKCDMWNRTQLSQSARTHGLGWRTAHASSID